MEIKQQRCDTSQVSVRSTRGTNRVGSMRKGGSRVDFKVASLFTQALFAAFTDMCEIRGRVSVQSRPQTRGRAGLHVGLQILKQCGILRVQLLL